MFKSGKKDRRAPPVAPVEYEEATNPPGEEYEDLDRVQNTAVYEDPNLDHGEEYEELPDERDYVEPVADPASEFRPPVPSPRMPEDKRPSNPAVAAQGLRVMPPTIDTMALRNQKAKLARTPSKEDQQDWKADHELKEFEAVEDAGVKDLIARFQQKGVKAKSPAKKPPSISEDNDVFNGEEVQLRSPNGDSLGNTARASMISNTSIGSSDGSDGPSLPPRRSASQRSTFKELAPAAAAVANGNAQPKAAPTPRPEEATLKGCSWYFGILSRGDATDMIEKIKSNGAFLIRRSESGGEMKPYTLDVYFGGRTWHLPIRVRPDGKFALGQEKNGEQTFESLPQFVIFYQTDNELHLMGQGGGDTKLVRHPPKLDDEYYDDVRDDYYDDVR